MHRRLLSTLLVTPILVVSACSEGDDSGSDLDIKKGNPSPSASAAPTASPRPATTAEAAKLQVSVLGTSVADTADEKAAVDAWMTYWQGVTDTYADLKPSPKLDVARDAALDRVLDYLNVLKSKGHRTVGWGRDNITSISVKDGNAIIADCLENFSFDVDQKGKAVEEAVPYYTITGSLKKDQGAWLVTGVDPTSAESDCMPG